MLRTLSRLTPRGSKKFSLSAGRATALNLVDEFRRGLVTFLELLEIGPVNFDIRSSVPSLLCACGLGWADGNRKIVLIGAGCAVRSVFMVCVCGVGPFVVRSCYFQGLGAVLGIPDVPGIQFRF